ncbi:MAG: ornithine carbamoyltransferase [Acidimicrobiales bacterium]
MTRHLLSLADLSTEELALVIELSEDPAPAHVLAGLGVALVFEHPSARTRNAFELAVFQLGGHPVSIRGEEVGIDKRETAEDVARTLACYHSMVAARVERHGTLERMAAALDEAGEHVPVVNLLSDREHPTQVVADLLTMRQRLGSLEGRILTYVGDVNNVCRSLIAGCARSGMTLNVASPAGFGLTAADLRWAEELGGNVRSYSEPEEAVAEADAVYTDVWVSMGQDDEAWARRHAFAGFGLDEVLMQHARDDVLVMHCLPAHRGEEISSGVMEGTNSVVWQQAANRMHAARGILRFLREIVLEGAS